MDSRRDRVAQPLLPKRLIRNQLRFKDTPLPTSSSAASSPMTLENLKPCPEQGLATKTCGKTGCQSKMKCSSGVLVYMQTIADFKRPSAAGRNRLNSKR